MTLFAWLYVGAAVWLALYGANALILTALFFRARSRHTPGGPFVPTRSSDGASAVRDGVLRGAKRLLDRAVETPRVAQVDNAGRETLRVAQGDNGRGETLRGARGDKGGRGDEGNGRQWPVVTVQLPVYNEQQVVRRLIDAVARLHYPRHRLHIQVLDDSTDQTTEFAAERVAYWQSRGRWITLHHRSERVDYKAGALRTGLAETPGEFVAIFDADFVPPRDWVKRTLAPFLEPGGDRIGMVQTRWSHLNDEFSALTRAQALALDGHFGVEQAARCSSGLLFNFNGTAGIWRRECIESAGGWRGETLSEDLDLSYRAQLLGWKFVYLPEVTAPAEIPPLMAGFKRQQFRWAKGSIQCARLLGPSLLRAPIGPWQKLQAFLHLTGYLVHPLMVLLLLASLPLHLGDLYSLHRIPLTWLGIASLGAPLLYATAQWSLYPGERWWHRFAWIPFLAMLGTGVAASNTRAVLEGLAGHRSAFQRTPKTGLRRRGRGWERSSAEPIRVDVITWVELFLSAYALVASVLALRAGNWLSILFLALYLFGFAWVGGATLWQARANRPLRRVERRLRRAERL